jgi:hypothetical protein
MKSIGERELAWLEKFANPRYPREPLYRAFYDHQEVSTAVQMQVLRGYPVLVLLLVPEQAKLTRPTIRHPDLSLSNILVFNTSEITGLIDWQHTSVLPLFLQAKIPKYFRTVAMKTPRTSGLPDCQRTSTTWKRASRFLHLRHFARGRYIISMLDILSVTTKPTSRQ